MRKLKVKDFVETIDALREKGYDVDNMEIHIVFRNDHHYSEDPAWSLLVTDSKILLEA